MIILQKRAGRAEKAGEEGRRGGGGGRARTSAIDTVQSLVYLNVLLHCDWLGPS